MPEIISCPSCSKETYAGIADCPHCGQTLLTRPPSAPTEGLKPVILSTGPLPGPFTVVDTVFAMDSSAAGLFFGADPNAAFEGVKEALKGRARELDGDAVVNCLFEYRSAVTDGFLGPKGVIEIFAYGTVIKFERAEQQDCKAPSPQ